MRPEIRHEHKESLRATNNCKVISRCYLLSCSWLVDVCNNCSRAIFYYAPSNIYTKSPPPHETVKIRNMLRFLLG